MIYNVFKVVRYMDGKYYSCNSKHTSLEYKIGNITLPKIGKIFCFDRYQTAKDFRINTSEGINYRILLCETDNIIYGKYRFIANAFEEQIEKFWAKTEFEQANMWDSFYTPDGTIFVDKCKPVLVLN